MNNHKNKRSMTTAVLLAVMIMAAAMMPVAVHAGSNIPVTVEITVTYIVDGNVETAGGDRFTLEADDPGAPMPEGTAEGKKTITVRDEGSYGFGDMHFGGPGVFWYTITREVTDKKGVVKDDSIYRAKVIALNDGHGYVLVYKKGSDEKHELVYMDRVAPATGDNSIVCYFCMAVAAAAALAAFAAAGRINKRRAARNETEKTAQ